MGSYRAIAHGRSQHGYMASQDDNSLSDILPCARPAEARSYQRTLLYIFQVLDNLFILQLHSWMPGVSSSLRFKPCSAVQEIKTCVYHITSRILRTFTRCRLCIGRDCLIYTINITKRNTLCSQLHECRSPLRPLDGFLLLMRGATNTKGTFHFSHEG